MIKGLLASWQCSNMHACWSLSISEVANSLDENQIPTLARINPLCSLKCVTLLLESSVLVLFLIFKLLIVCLLLLSQCGRIAGFNCKSGIDLEQVTWPEMGVHGARQLMQLQQQFWHGDLAHPHQVASQWEKRGDGHPPVFSNSSPSLFGYDLTSSGKSCTQSYIAFLTELSCLSLISHISAWLAPRLLSLTLSRLFLSLEKKIYR